MDFDSFHKQVKDALEHLHDAAHLQTHPLLARLHDTASDSHSTRAQKLRAWLKNAIEQLKPAPDLPSSSPEWRCYLALRYRYVQRMNPVNIESELGISQRQLYRELAKGLDALAALLWEQRAPERSDLRVPEIETRELENELSQWNLTRQKFDVRALITETIATLQPTITARDIAVYTDFRDDVPPAFVDATLTRQALLNVLRLVVNQTRDQITVGVGAQEKLVHIVIVAEDVRIDFTAEDWRNAELLCRAQGAILDLNTLGQTVILLPRAAQTRVLVIDDNPAIQQLFERYLAPQQYEVIHAQSGDDALRLAAESQPDAITLDVMMPRMDGWQVLRALAQNPATAKIPVVVCSVLKEPELALSLGARAYLKKPVDRLTLVETLARVVS
ncbi:MAG: response regulator [Chloroflexi bacterium]|nr:response regulator [Chloroflexota bacterium]